MNDSLWRSIEATPALRGVFIVVIVLAIIALAAAAFLLVLHGFTSRRRSRRGVMVRRAAALLAPHLVSGTNLPTAVTESRQRYGDWATAVVLREARLDLTGLPAAGITAALEQMGEVDRLSKAVRSPFAWRRVLACRELGDCGGERALPSLLAATEDRAHEVRRAARYGLLATGSKEAITAAIESHLHDASAGGPWKRGFFGRLATVGSEALCQLVEEGRLQPAEEKLALEALGDSGNPNGLRLAKVRLSSPDPEIRATAARVVGKLQDRESIPVLSNLLRDPEWFVRAAAAKAFASVPADSESLPRLAENLSDQNWWVRTNSAHALARQQDGGPLLLKALDGGDPYALDASLAAFGLVLLDPAARSRFPNLAERLAGDPHAEPLRPILDALQRAS